MPITNKHLIQIHLQNARAFITQSLELIQRSDDCISAIEKNSRARQEIEIAVQMIIDRHLFTCIPKKYFQKNVSKNVLKTLELVKKSHLRMEGYEKYA